MKIFSGFPARMQYTPVPDLFYSELLPQIDDMDELKVTLYLFHVIARKRSDPRFASFSELAGSASLMRSLKNSAEALRQALASAVKRGTLLSLALEKDGAAQAVYFLNTTRDRQAMERVMSGEIELKGLAVAPPAPDLQERPDIYTLYEENIGMLTPMVAEELKSAEKLYPQARIAEAIRQAVKHNKRKWSYIAAILERWATEGKDDGTHQRDIEATDPDKYVKGKYGHLVQR